MLKFYDHQTTKLTVIIFLGFLVQPGSLLALARLFPGGDDRVFDFFPAVHKDLSPMEGEWTTVFHRSNDTHIPTSYLRYDG